MDIVRHATADAWFLQVAPLLKAQEVEFGLVWSIANHYLGQPEPRALFYTVEIDGRVAAFAIRTQGQKLLFPFDLPEVVEALVERTLSDIPDLSGINAPERTAARFRDHWCQATAQVETNSVVNILYAATELVPPRATPGTARPASPKDRDDISAWAHQFVVETHLDATGEELAEAFRTHLHNQNLLVWDTHNRPVSMAILRKQSPRTSRVSFVFTPPEHRGQGYGSQVTAAATEQALGAGDTHVTLFAEGDNPQSNRIYQRLGYGEVGRYAELTFSPDASAARRRS
ncbi:MAG: GNAT family N-acetyltransferase [Myxococcales bacterium]|nr:GNAT family N-acetyltransferase [Myxococcales bacterium]